MPADVVVQFRVGGIADVQKAFGSVLGAAERAEKANTAGAAKAAKKREQVAKTEAANKQSIYTRYGTFTDAEEKRRTSVHEREATKRVRVSEQEHRRREAIVRKSSDMAGRLASKLAREEEAATRRSFATKERFARQIVNRGLSGTAGAIMGGVRNAAGLVTQLGGGFSLGDTLQKSLGAERAAALLANSAYIPGTNKRPDKKDILSRAGAVSASTNTDKSELIEATRGYVAKSADFTGGMENMEFFAKLAKGSGSSVKDIANAAGILRTQNANLSPSQMQDMLRNVVIQGKQGSMEMEDLAHVAGKITKTSAMYGGDQAENQRKLLGLSQFAMKTSGGPDEAATVISNVGSDALKHAKKIEAHGIAARGADGKLIGQDQLLANVMQGTGGNLGKIQDLGFGQRSMKMFEALAPTFDDATAAARAKNPKASSADVNKAGADAVLAAIKQVTGATYSQGDVDKDFQNVMDTTAEKFEGAMLRLKAVVAEKVTPFLERFANKLPEALPHIESLLESLGKLAVAFEENPFAGLGVAFATLLGEQIAAAAIGDVVRTNLAKLLSTSVGGGLTILTAAIVAEQVGEIIINDLVKQEQKLNKANLATSTAGTNTALSLSDAAITGKVTAEQLQAAQAQQGELGKLSQRQKDALGTQSTGQTVFGGALGLAKSVIAMSPGAALADAFTGSKVTGGLTETQQQMQTLAYQSQVSELKNTETAMKQLSAAIELSAEALRKHAAAAGSDVPPAAPIAARP